MTTIFTKIINREIPCYKVAETDRFFAFLDINPLAKGHTLVIPKKEVDYLFDLDDSTFTGLMQFSMKVALAIDKSVKCTRVGMAVIGLEVPHAHIHLVPINHIHDIDFKKPRVKINEDEFESIANTIANNMKS